MSATPPYAGLSQIGQIALTVRDLPRAVAFYRDTLGVPFLFEVPGLAFFDCAGVRLMLGVAESAEQEGRSSIVYYRVPEIGAAHAALRERGVRFEDEPHLVARMPDHELWMAFFRDSEEN